MRCPSCNKFASFEEIEPEFDRLEVSAGSGISGECRIVNACADDGEELKEATLDIDVDCGEELAEHAGEGHELEVEAEDGERTSRTEGKGRGAKMFYGASANFLVTCSCTTLGDKGEGVTFKWDDDVQASSMDEVV